jgi:hypothetical protein
MDVDNCKLRLGKGADKSPGPLIKGPRQPVNWDDMSGRLQGDSRNGPEKGYESMIEQPI